MPVSGDQRWRTVGKTTVAAGLTALPLIALTYAVTQRSRTATVTMRSTNQRTICQLVGSVLDETAGKPLSQAAILLQNSTGTDSRATTTDSDGRFSFVDLHPGTYRLAAKRFGYVPLEYGQRRSFDVADPLTLKAGIRRTVTIALSHGSSISGRIVDRLGRSVEPALVSIVRCADVSRSLARTIVPWESHREELDAARVLATTRSDHAGAYRFVGLPAGCYYVLADSATPRGGAAQFARTFFPSAVDLDTAQQVILSNSTELRADITPGNVTMYSISGAVVTSSGAFATGGHVRFGRIVRAADGSSSSGGTWGEVQVKPNGEFTITGLSTGNYWAYAMTAVRVVDEKLTTMEFGYLDISAPMEPVMPVRLYTARGSTLRGRVSIPGETQSDMSLVRLVASPVESLGWGLAPAQSGSVARDGSFELHNVFGHILLSVTSAAGEGASIDSVHVRDTDITEKGLVASPSNVFDDLMVQLESSPHFISGHVDGPQGIYSVLVFSADETKWTNPTGRYILVTRTTSDGAFQLRVPPGGYFVIAFEWVDTRASLTPLMLRAIEPQATQGSADSNPARYLHVPLGRRTGT